jgi:hypothetical protein
MSYKRVKNVAGAPNGEDDTFDEDYDEEEERELAYQDMSGRTVGTNVSRDES